MIRTNQASQPDAPGRRNEPRGRQFTRLAGVLAAAVVISWGGPAASAFWQALGSNAGVARADSIPAVAAPGASVAGGSASVTWKQGTTAEGRPVAGYTVARYSAATAGTRVAAGGGCSGTITALACSEVSLPAGTWYYTVTPVLGAWAGVESARSGGVTAAAADTTPPAAPGITAPALINSAPATTNSANAASVPVRGTAEANSSVTVTVKDAGGVHTASQTMTANGSGQWTSTNFDLTTFADGTITYSAVATDAAGNASVAGTATSAKDTVGPTATVTLSNVGKNNTLGIAETGDTVSIKYGSDIDGKSLCTGWSNSAVSEIAGNNVVTVTISSDTLTVTTAGAACTPNIGPITLGGSYVTSGSLVFKGNGNGGGASKVTWDGANQTLLITLGTRVGAAKENVGESSPTVAPPPGVTDVNGNQAVGAQLTSPSRF